MINTQYVLNKNKDELLLVYKNGVLFEVFEMPKNSPRLVRFKDKNLEVEYFLSLRYEKWLHITESFTISNKDFNWYKKKMKNQV